MPFLDTPITYLKGVGPAKANALERELGIVTYGDMLMHYPFRYIDCSQSVDIRNINVDDQYLLLRGRISDMHTVGTGSGQRLTARLSDSTGSVELVWFKGIKYISQSLKPNVVYNVIGKPTVYNGHINIAHPDIEPLAQDGEETPRYIPVYSTTERLRNMGLSPKGIAKITARLIRLAQGLIPETLPCSLLRKYNLPTREKALCAIHHPMSPSDITASINRLKFEELFFLQFDSQYARLQRHKSSSGYPFPIVGHYFNDFYNTCLPFPLTDAQKRVVREIRADMKSGFQMNRLLQGDVGSGKTLVALLSILIALDNGCQACIMAPTEILATQHYDTVSRMVAPLGINVALLTGSLKGSAKKSVKTALANGDIQILIGTHALIENDVVFKRLGLVVIDEQHRFGVEQRSRLWTKSVITPHVLVMTATPIPRTLAMTLYGHLDCSVIDQLPPGRKPVKTIHATDSSRLKLFAFIRSQIAVGRQIYVVYPLIEESQSSDLKDLMDGYESLVREFPLPHYQISILHGQMPPDAKDYEMQRFKSGQTNIIVSTTVIEVGVDVPNATVMVIENAERFGLSQLHQLRGRVGRGGEQSYCILMTSNKLSASAAQRISTMVETTDGFRIAEADLRLRGPGDMQGLQQSGILQLKIADIANDQPLLSAARDSVEQILRDDPKLQEIDNGPLYLYLKKKKNTISWEKIS